MKLLKDQGRETNIKTEKRIFFSFQIRTFQLDIITVFYSPTDAQVNCPKKQYYN